MPDSKAMEVLTTRIEHVTARNAALLQRIGYTPEAYARVAINALVLNPDIASCTKQSLDQAVIKCINAGLIPDGDEAAFVPFKQQAVFIPMVKGRIKLARQATPGLTLRAMAVYDGDTWEYAEGLYPKLHHVPTATDNSPDKLTYVYAIVRVPGSAEPEYDVMNRDTIDRYRSYSLTKKGGPWKDHFEEMAKNAVTKRLLKRMPKSVNDPGPLPPELEYIDTREQIMAINGGDDAFPELPPPTTAPFVAQPVRTQQPLDANPAADDSAVADQDATDDDPFW